MLFAKESRTPVGKVSKRSQTLDDNRFEEGSSKKAWKTAVIIQPSHTPGGFRSSVSPETWLLFQHKCRSLALGDQIYTYIIIGDQTYAYIITYVERITDESSSSSSSSSLLYLFSYSEQKE